MFVALYRISEDTHYERRYMIFGIVRVSEKWKGVRVVIF